MRQRAVLLQRADDEGEHGAAVVLGQIIRAMGSAEESRFCPDRAAPGSAAADLVVDIDPLILRKYRWLLR